LFPIGYDDFQALESENGHYYVFEFRNAGMYYLNQLLQRCQWANQSGTDVENGLATAASPSFGENDDELRETIRERMRGGSFTFDDRSPSSDPDYVEGNSRKRGRRSIHQGRGKRVQRLPASSTTQTRQRETLGGAATPDRKHKAYTNENQDGEEDLDALFQVNRGEVSHAASSNEGVALQSAAFMENLPHRDTTEELYASGTPAPHQVATGTNSRVEAEQEDGAVQSQTREEIEIEEEELEVDREFEEKRARVEHNYKRRMLKLREKKRKLQKNDEGL
jgi:hypothetical protein